MELGWRNQLLYIYNSHILVKKIWMLEESNSLTFIIVFHLDPFYRVMGWPQKYNICQVVVC